MQAASFVVIRVSLTYKDFVTFEIRYALSVPWKRSFVKSEMSFVFMSKRGNDTPWFREFLSSAICANTVEDVYWYKMCYKLQSHCLNQSSRSDFLASDIIKMITKLLKKNKFIYTMLFSLKKSGITLTICAYISSNPESSPYHGSSTPPFFSSNKTNFALGFFGCL